MKNFTYKREYVQERERETALHRRCICASSVDAIACVLCVFIRNVCEHIKDLVGYSGECVYVFPSFLIIFDIPLARCANTVGRGQHVSCIQ